MSISTLLDGSHVRVAAAATVDMLRRSVDDDWTVTVPGLELTVAQVVAHVAETCLWYAIDLTAAGVDLQAVEQRIKPDSSASDLADAFSTYTQVVATVIDAADPGVRGFHPFGLADRTGFAAMACDEILIHTDDIARGLGLGFDPGGELAALVLTRIFPWVEVDSDSDAWQLLRWANGRIALGDRPQLTRWRWFCAPLDEWDGTVPG